MVLKKKIKTKYKIIEKYPETPNSKTGEVVDGIAIYPEEIEKVAKQMEVPVHYVKDGVLLHEYIHKEYPKLSPKEFSKKFKELYLKLYPDIKKEYLKKILDFSGHFSEADMEIYKKYGKIKVVNPQNPNMEEEKKEIAKKIYEELNESERFGLMFGLFPFRIADKIKDKEIAAELIRIATKERRPDWLSSNPENPNNPNMEEEKLPKFESYYQLDDYLSQKFPKYVRVLDVIYDLAFKTRVEGWKRKDVENMILEWWNEELREEVSLSDVRPEYFLMWHLKDEIKKNLGTNPSNPKNPKKKELYLEDLKIGQKVMTKKRYITEDLEGNEVTIPPYTWGTITYIDLQGEIHIDWIGYPTTVDIYMAELHEYIDFDPERVDKTEIVYIARDLDKEKAKKEAKNWYKMAKKVVGERAKHDYIVKDGWTGREWTFSWQELEENPSNPENLNMKKYKVCYNFEGIGEKCFIVEAENEDKATQKGLDKALEFAGEDIRFGITRVKELKGNPSNPENPEPKGISWVEIADYFEEGMLNLEEFKKKAPKEFYERFKKYWEEETGEDLEERIKTEDPLYTTLYTLDALKEEYLEVAEESGVPEPYISYLDAEAMIEDDEMSGYLNDIEFGGVKVYYREY